MHVNTYTFLHFLAPLAAFAAPYAIDRNNSIKWAACNQELSVAADCGTLPVPLDYTDQGSGKTLNLSMLRVKATKEPFLGSILINPGGPGNGAINFLKGYGAHMLVMTGGHFDIIGFDPRGTGDTLLINCYEDPLERVRAVLSRPSLTNASDAALGTTWAIQKTFAGRCSENARDVGELMGTAFVARDMMQIVDALGEDGLLRFWGQSYGSLLGATVASMFPDRIDKLVIDGVVNPHDYTDGWEYEPGPVGDLTLSKYLGACINAGEEACPLASKGSTVEDLTTQIYDLVDTVKYEPIVLGNNITTDTVTISDVVGGFNIALRVAIVYAIPLAGYLNAILDRNTTAYHLYRPLIFPDAGPSPANDDAVYSIRCGDAIFRADDLSTLEPRVERLLSESRLFGDTYTSSFMQCAQWPFQAKGRYEGDFTAKTLNPALIIGSPYDLRTPLVSAHNVSAGLEGSVVLQHNGLGHCVLYSPGQCAIKAMQDYFTNGTLPPPGTQCEQDFDVFSGKKIEDSFGL